MSKRKSNLGSKNQRWKKYFQDVQLERLAKQKPSVELGEMLKLLESVASPRKPLPHERHNAETFGMFAHYGWALFSASQGLLSVAFAWAWYGIGRLFDSPAAQFLFWISVSSAIFGLGGTIWHGYAGREHARARRARRSSR
jgi:hypothetical protein